MSGGFRSLFVISEDRQKSARVSSLANGRFVVEFEYGAPDAENRTIRKRFFGDQVEAVAAAYEGIGFRFDDEDRRKRKRHKEPGASGMPSEDAPYVADGAPLPGASGSPMDTDPPPG